MEHECVLAIKHCDLDSGMFEAFEIRESADFWNGWFKSFCFYLNLQASKLELINLLFSM